MVKNKLKEFSGNFKGQAVLVLDYKKRNDRKVIHSSTKIIASDSDIDESFKTMHQSIITKVKNYACEDCIVSVQL